MFHFFYVPLETNQRSFSQNQIHHEKQIQTKDTVILRKAKLRSLFSDGLIGHFMILETTERTVHQLSYFLKEIGLRVAASEFLKADYSSAHIGEHGASPRPTSNPPPRAPGSPHRPVLTGDSALCCSLFTKTKLMGAQDRVSAEGALILSGPQPQPSALEGWVLIWATGCVPEESHARCVFKRATLSASLCCWPCYL